MVIRPFTKTLKVIDQNSSYKLADLIRDTWPQLFWLNKNFKGKLNGSINTKSPEEGVVRCP